MSKIKLTTITPIHIGSGVLYQNDRDFVTFKDEYGPGIAIVDLRKMGDLLQKHGGTNLINKWVAAIERRDSVKDFIKRFAPDAALEDYALRLLTLPYNINFSTDTTLKEYIHDGMGHAYVPGSSIKGAIRTAIFAQLKAEDHHVNVRKCKELEGRFFGEIPNEDFMRFLRVGDAFFEDGCKKYIEDCINMVHLNIREKCGLLDRSKQQAIEVVTEKESAFFRLHLIQENGLRDMIMRYNNVAEKNGKATIHLFPDAVHDLQSLFSIINEHTKKLMRSELEIWEDEEVERFFKDDDQDVADAYKKAIRSILRKAEKCREKECVLRVGHASGWRFMTGAWAENQFDDATWRQLQDASRPHNRNYEQYRFPKTRRVFLKGDDGIGVLGFVKLKIVE